MRLQEFPFTIQYIPGSDNVEADALSRIPWPLAAVDPRNSDVSDDEVGLFCNEMIENEELCLALSFQMQQTKEIELTLENIRFE